MALNPALKQVSNRNFLSPVGFKLKINKCPKVDFLAVQANLPGITLGTALQPNPYKDIELPGEKLVYDDFRVSFIVDEEMENYNQIYKWMIGLGYPNSQRDFTDMKLEDVYHPEIGDSFGGRDHTTVIHACKKIAELRDNDITVNEDFKNVVRLLTL